MLTPPPGRGEAGEKKYAIWLEDLVKIMLKSRSSLKVTALGHATSTKNGKRYEENRTIKKVWIMPQKLARERDTTGV